jgi:nucleotide-binding universal stress UspA family protein
MVDLWQTKKSQSARHAQHFHRTEALTQKRGDGYLENVDLSMKGKVKTSPISRANKRQRLVRTILAPIDFSDRSLTGLTYAVRLAKEIGGCIIVLHVTDLGPVMMTSGCGDYDSPTYTEAARRRCGDRMQAFLKRVDFDGIPVETSDVAGYCPAAIYEAAAKEGADLIIISTHGRTGLRRALIGSVAEGTVRHAACPVLVVPSFANAHENSLGESSRQSLVQTRSEKSTTGRIKQCKQ